MAFTPQNSRRGSNTRTLCRIVVLFLTVLPLLLARTDPPSFRLASSRSTVRSLADQGPRQCFDHEDARWVKPASAVLPPPVPDQRARLTHPSGPFLPIPSDELYYNRPPPVS